MIDVLTLLKEYGKEGLLKSHLMQKGNLNTPEVESILDLFIENKIITFDIRGKRRKLKFYTLLSNGLEILDTVKHLNNLFGFKVYLFKDYTPWTFKK